MVSEALEQNPSPEEEYSTRMAAMAMFTGGSDTVNNWSTNIHAIPFDTLMSIQTVSAIMTFFLAMLIHPEIQRKAQAEINRVIGTDRLPRLEDRASLTFVDAMVKEILRWGVVIPMGSFLQNVRTLRLCLIFYRHTARCKRRGHVQWISDPETFNRNGEHLGRLTWPGNLPWSWNVQPWSTSPWRKKGQKECWKRSRSTRVVLWIWQKVCILLGRTWQNSFQRTNYVFFGRVCPGKELADAQIFITIATVLATLDISRVRDENGREVIPHKHMESGVIRFVTDFLPWFWYNGKPIVHSLAIQSRLM